MLVCSFFYLLPFSPTTTLECSDYFSLFFFHMDRVYFGTLNFLETSLLVSPRSISVNAANFRSNVCSLWHRLFPAILAISSKSQQQLLSYKIKFRENTWKILHCNDFTIYVFKNKLKTNNLQCNGFIAQVPNLSWLQD